MALLGVGVGEGAMAAHPHETLPDTRAGVPAASAAPPLATYDVDIPQLPLADALARYGELTGYSVFYETRVVAGKQSAPVRGRFTAEAALTRLLGDAALRARFMNRRSIMLLAQPAPDTRPALAPSPAQRRYDGQLQRQITRALCANPAIGAGRYRIALRFSVGSDQRLHQIRVRVAESPDREPIVLAALADVAVGTPPPDAVQPVVMVVSPEAARRHGGCPP